MCSNIADKTGDKGPCTKQLSFIDSNQMVDKRHMAKSETEGRKVFVLRLGHRIGRDDRATMHVFLTARALDALGVFYSGQRDEALERRIREVVNRWGGSFEVRYEKNWKSAIKNWKEKGVVCHLTMYGININDCLDKIPKDKNILIVIGSEKVPSDVFQLANFNIAIGNQPHSEIAALAIFLDRFFQGEGLKKRFENAKMRVEPQQSGKKIILQP